MALLRATALALASSRRKRRGGNGAQPRRLIKLTDATFDSFINDALAAGKTAMVRSSVTAEANAFDQQFPPRLHPRLRIIRMWCSGTSICQRTRSGSGTAFNLTAGRSSAERPWPSTIKIFQPSQYENMSWRRSL